MSNLSQSSVELNNKPLRYSWYILLILSGILIAIIHWRFFPNGVNFLYTFEPTVTSWLNGQALYMPPYRGFFNAPWLVIALIPLLWLGYKGAQTALVLLTLGGIFAGWRVFARAQDLTNWQALSCAVLCIANLHTFDLILRGQIDVFVMLGLVLIYLGLKKHQPHLLGIGWVSAMVRPTSILLVIIYSLIIALRERYFRRSLVIPLLFFGLSLLIFGIDWPIRWYNQIRFSAPPRPGPWLITWPHAAAYLQLNGIFSTTTMLFFLIGSTWIIYHYNPSLTLAVALLAVGSVLVVPYVLSYHYPVVMCAAMPPLFRWKKWLFWLFYPLTLTPLLRLYFGLDIAWIDIGLPLVTWILLCMHIIGLHHSADLQTPRTSHLDTARSI